MHKLNPSCDKQFVNNNNYSNNDNNKILYIIHYNKATKKLKK